jgi:hypothetical protein
VRAQVDRYLTTVSRVDRRLRLIKNLGRHGAPCPRRSRPCAARGILHPRPPATPGRAASEATRAPRHAGVRARTTHRRTGRTRPPSVRRSVRDLPPSCAVPRPEHHVVVTTGRAVPLFKRSPRLFAPLDLSLAVLLRRRGRRRQAAALLRLWATAHVSSFLRTRSTFPCHALPPVRPPLAGARAAAGHRRAPTTATSPPQPRPPPNPR